MFFLIFGAVVDNSYIEKLIQLFFQKKNLFFSKIWAKRTQNDSKIGFFGFFEKFCHVSFNWN